MLRKSIFITSILLYAAGTAVCQDYVVNISGDTLAGKVRLYNNGPDKKAVVTGGDRKKVSVPLFKVRTARLNDEVYQPVKGPSEYAFMKLLKEGYLSLYGFQMPNQSTYDGMMLSKKDGTVLEVPNLNFKRSLKKFLDDCPSTAMKIEDGVFSRKDIAAIVDDYNGCLESRQTSFQTPSNNTPVVQPPAWQSLRDDVSALPDFDGKNDALEMIKEIMAKLTRKEKVPNFMIEGLKSTLAGKGVDQSLNNALAEIQ